MPPRLDVKAWQMRLAVRAKVASLLILVPDHMMVPRSWLRSHGLPPHVHADGRGTEHGQRIILDAAVGNLLRILTAPKLVR